VEQLISALAERITNRTDISAIYGFYKEAQLEKIEKMSTDEVLRMALEFDLYHEVEHYKNTVDK
jgi:hypothetical protein